MESFLRRAIQAVRKLSPEDKAAARQRLLDYLSRQALNPFSVPKPNR